LKLQKEVQNFEQQRMLRVGAYERLSILLRPVTVTKGRQLEREVTMLSR